MFDIGWSELLLIGVVALLVVGPKDLPDMLRTMGRFTAKARSMAREFSRAMEDAARESGVSEVTKDLRAMTSKKSLGLDALDGAVSKFESWDPMKTAAARKAAATGVPAAVATSTVASHGPATTALIEQKAAKAAARKAAAAERAADAEMAAEYAEIDAPDTKPRKAATRKSAAAKPGAKPSAAKPRPQIADVAPVKAAAKRSISRKPAAKAD